jgi:2-polyprenyl-6-methoxyphenol hydroxylase-like FAD-dependent oxidoreductase
MYSSLRLPSITETQVLISGGGPTGLTLAIVLRRYGITCRIIDRDPEEHSHSRGKGIQPRTLEVFDDLGIVDEIKARGISSGKVRFYTNTQPVAEVVVPQIAPRPGIPYPSLLIVPQFETERILRERLDVFGVTVERGRELVSFHDDGEQVIATVKDRVTGELEEIACAYVIGCDGGRSFVRRQLGLRFDGENHDQYWILGDMEITGLDRDVTAHAWFADDSYLNATKLPGVNGWQVQASIQLDAAGHVAPASLELFQRLFTERTALSDVHVSNATWLSNYHVKRRMVDRYRQGRVFVAGDAAHIHSPAGGQGLNTGVQDAYNLGWKLALVLQGKADVKLLDTYEEERLPVAQGVLRTSETGNRLFFSTNPIITFFRRFVFLPILQQPWVTTALLLKTAELDLNYRGMSLAQESLEQPDGLRRWFAKRALRAGDRAPDALVRDGRTDKLMRLFDAFRGAHWTLLLFSGRTHNTTDNDRLAKIAQTITATYGDDVRPYLIFAPSGSSTDQHSTRWVRGGTIPANFGTCLVFVSLCCAFGATRAAGAT